jgi:hypothetical protein
MTDPNELSKEELDRLWEEMEELDDKDPEDDD